VFSDLAETPPDPLIDPLAATSKFARSQSAYLKARRRRSMRTTVGLSIATIIIALLILALFYILRGEGGV
jgi:hypothetical protein